MLDNDQEASEGAMAPHRGRPKILFGIDWGKLEILGEIVDPIEVDWKSDTGEGWELD